VLRAEFRVKGGVQCRGGIPCRGGNSVDTQLYILLKKTLKSVFIINIDVFSFFF
jgi:hypothetical protein